MKTLKLSEEEYRLIINQRRSAKLGVVAMLFEEKAQIEEDINNAIIVKELKKLGFTLVYFESERFGFINYNHPKIDGKFYSIHMENGDLTKKRDDVSDEDFEAVKNLLKLNEEK
jgi:hypothetical protein